MARGGEGRECPRVSEYKAFDRLYTYTSPLTERAEAFRDVRGHVRSGPWGT